MLLMVTDKWIAVKNRKVTTDHNAAWRISENTLHFAEFFGGWWASWLVQVILRHKSSKVDYQIRFWAIVVVHSLAIAGAIVVRNGQNSIASWCFWGIVLPLAIVVFHHPSKRQAR